MTIRLFAHVPKDGKPILDILSQMSGDDLKVVLTTGDQDADIKASSLSVMNMQKGTSGHFMASPEFKGTCHSIISDPTHFEDMERFVDHLQRTSATYKYRSHNLNNLQDYLDYYHILRDVVADRIIKSGATHMLFFNIPHMGYDTMFYQVGLALGLKPVILLQSLFSDQYMSMQTPTDYGNFSPKDTTAAPYFIDNESPLELFYMKKITEGAPEKGKITSRAVLNLFAHILTKDPLKALNPVWMFKTIRRMNAIYGSFPKWRDPFHKFFHTDDLAYFEHLAEHEQTPVNLDQKFIYFALQQQPEMTTSAIGHKYRDQVLAIEDLARLLPEDVKIYVKENPKQMGFSRGPMFFHRLARIPAVEIMPSYADTHQLTDASLAVATITGTVGWEAICKGKPAICFGDTWYQSLAGVHRFSAETRWEDIQSMTVDHEQLQMDAGALVERSHKGTLHRHYSRNVPDFDVDQNNERIAHTILGLLNRTESFSFPPAADRK